MKKIYLKLAASLISILVAFTMVIGATYAWLTLSSSPAVNGISVTLGGGKTIMLAPDLTKTVVTDGKETVIHYPGAFGSTLNISQYDTYDYLGEVAGLSPVSTADGLYWLLPAYEEGTGMLKPAEEFAVDGKLMHANVTEKTNGSYVYLDFWMVSPGSEYNIRVSTDTRNNIGSYLIELPSVKKGSDGSWQLTQSQGIVESVARIGFLVNTDTAGTEGMTSYISSPDFNSNYKSLQGVYTEKGEEPSAEYRFTIYEPNAVRHPSGIFEEGAYVITRPLQYNPYGNTILEEDVSGRLMVQGNNTWKTSGETTQLQEMFQAAQKKNTLEWTEETADAVFYEEYLRGQVASYVKTGNFYKNAASLYEAAVDGVVSAEAMNLEMAGATDDAIITTLTANTPQRVRMFIWLEGQDADCVNQASVETSGLALNLELSGANQ